jgi:ABC-type phosphate/phosphonate transport system substrate-binding protein
MSKARWVTAIAGAAVLAGGGALAYSYWNQEKAVVNVQTQLAQQQPLVFTAPPRETPEEGERVYKPIADYLSQAIGKRIVYRHSPTWGMYRTEMLAGNFDIVFDGPHFLDYRVQRLNHNVLAKIEKPLEFVVFVRKDEKAAVVAELGGKTFCTQSPPNLGALTLLAQFKDVQQPPVLVPAKGWSNVYEGVSGGTCTGGIMPKGILKKLDESATMKVVQAIQPIQNQGFSAGPRVSPEDQARIAAALLAPEAAGPTEVLRNQFNVGPAFVPTNNTEYAGAAELLRSEWGFF